MMGDHTAGHDVLRLAREDISFDNRLFYPCSLVALQPGRFGRSWDFCVRCVVGISKDQEI